MAEEKEMTWEEARKKFKTFDVIAPELDNDMRPLIQLRDKSECPAKLDGICVKCKHFLDVYTEGEGIFAHGVYEGFCGFKED